MKGVSYDKARDRWTARLTVNGKRVQVGRFETEEEAKIALISYKAEHTSLLDTIPLKYERHDEGIRWLAPYRAWKRKRQAEKLKDQVNEEKLSKL